MEVIIQRRLILWYRNYFEKKWDCYRKYFKKNHNDLEIAARMIFVHKILQSHTQSEIPQKSTFEN